MNRERVIKYAPGVGASLVIAIVAVYLGSLVPVIGGSIFALTIGMVVKMLLPKAGSMDLGLTFVSKGVLKFAIILLGTGLSITQVLVVGKYSLFIMVFTLTAAFGSGIILGKLLGVNWRMTNLISAGTGVCGGSAIATLAPIVDAEDSDIAYAMAVTFIFDVAMIFIFPIVGRAMGLSDLAFGLWTGTAVNDTSSVVATGYAFSEAAGDFATIVKLTRTTSIVPIALIFAVLAPYLNARERAGKGPIGKKSVSVGKIFPWFILLFLVSALLNTLGLIPTEIGGWLKQASKFMMAMALAAIGLKTDFARILNAGIQPMVLGFLVSLIVAVVSLSVQLLNGQV
ncbi:MAG: putative sulfate exporter family transporter [Firmicutes bacterium]|nr:putative sulfate exporter family transporter [Bacillota bacterium]